MPSESNHPFPLTNRGGYSSTYMSLIRSTIAVKRFHSIGYPKTSRPRTILLLGEGRKHWLASVYPGNMSAPCSELPIRREEHAKDILVWMALSFFRHWFAQRIIDKKGSLRWERVGGPHETEKV